jgi:hypothetical protein
VDNVEILVSGYTSYTDAQELTASASAESPAASPVLSFIGISSFGCGAAVGSLIGGGVAGTVNVGC